MAFIMPIKGGHVADRNSRSGQVAAAPSGQFGGDPELDIDAAMQRLNQSRQAALARAGQSVTDEDELEVDDDETTEELDHTDDAPEEEDFEDDDEYEDEANTPSDDDEDDDDVTSLESDDKRQKSKKSGTPPDARKRQASAPESEEDDDDEETIKLSRKQRGKLIEELRQQVIKSEQEKAQIQQRIKAQQEEDERLAKEVQRALGSEEDYEKAMEEGLKGDETQAEKARIWKSNRAFFNKLVKQAERRVKTNLTEAYWDTAKELEGVDLALLREGTLPQVLKHVHEAGAASVEGKADERIEALESEVETWKGRYRALKAKAGSSKRSPVGAGGEPAQVKKTVDWKKKYLGKDGLPTDEADTLVMQRGFEALIQPSRRK